MEFLHLLRNLHPPVWDLCNLPKCDVPGAARRWWGRTIRPTYYLRRSKLLKFIIGLIEISLRFNVCPPPPLIRLSWVLCSQVLFILNINGHHKGHYFDPFKMYYHPLIWKIFVGVWTLDIRFSYNSFATLLSENELACKWILSELLVASKVCYGPHSLFL